MRTMALPALQEAFEHLSATTRTFTSEPVRTDEVLSLTMAKVIQLADAMIGRLSAWRGLLAETNEVLSEAIRHEPAMDDLHQYASCLVQARRCRRAFAAPFFAEESGLGSAKDLAGSLRSLGLSRPADARIAERQATRIDASAEALEAQRKRFVVVTDQLVTLLEAKVAGNEAFADVLVETIARQSIERFPVINEYLAR